MSFVRNGNFFFQKLQLNLNFLVTCMVVCAPGGWARIPHRGGSSEPLRPLNSQYTPPVNTGGEETSGA